MLQKAKPVEQETGQSSLLEQLVRELQKDTRLQKPEATPQFIVETLMETHRTSLLVYIPKPGKDFPEPETVAAHNFRDENGNPTTNAGQLRKELLSLLPEALEQVQRDTVPPKPALVPIPRTVDSEARIRFTTPEGEELVGREAFDRWKAMEIEREKSQ